MGLRGMFAKNLIFEKVFIFSIRYSGDSTQYFRTKTFFKQTRMNSHGYKGRIEAPRVRHLQKVMHMPSNEAEGIMGILHCDPNLSKCIVIVLFFFSLSI